MSGSARVLHESGSDPAEADLHPTLLGLSRQARSILSPFHPQIVIFRNPPQVYRTRMRLITGLLLLSSAAAFLLPAPIARTNVGSSIVKAPQGYDNITQSASAVRVIVAEDTDSALACLVCVLLIGNVSACSAPCVPSGALRRRMRPPWRPLPRRRTPTPSRAGRWCVCGSDGGQGVSSVLRCSDWVFRCGRT